MMHRSMARIWRTALSFVASFLLYALPTEAAQAGTLTIINSSGSTLNCSGAESISDGRSADVPLPTAGSINCGSLVLYAAPSQPLVSPTGLDLSYAVAVNGKQARVLRVALFPYLPSYPPGDLKRLLALLSREFQAIHPQVALEISTSVDVYDFGELPAALGQNGVDVLEIDTSILSGVENLISAVPPVAAAALPFAARAVAAPNGRQWGTPTWICRDFLFSYDSRLKQVDTLPQLLTYWSTIPTRSKIVGDFTGKFQLYAMYLNSYVARYGYGDQQINDALSKEIDPAVVADLISVVNGCGRMANERNPCAEGAFHNDEPDSMMEALFAAGYAATDEGFSERSFYMNLWRSAPLSVVPMPYGPHPIPLMYVDALVNSAARCSTEPCLTDAQDFAKYLTSADVRATIAFASDLKPVDGAFPPRHLLPATASFYALPQVTSDPFYTQIIPLFANAQPMPTTVTKVSLKRIASRLCDKLVAVLPNYGCQVTTTSQGP